MKKVYDVRFINNDGCCDETQLHANNEAELYELIGTLQEEMSIREVVETEEVASIIYCVAAIGYDSNDYVTDCDIDFGAYVTEEEARDKFDEVISEPDMLSKRNGIATWRVQIEECEVTDDCVECVDIIDEDVI